MKKIMMTSSKKLKFKTNYQNNKTKFYKNRKIY